MKITNYYLLSFILHRIRTTDSRHIIDSLLTGVIEIESCLVTSLLVIVYRYQQNYIVVVKAFYLSQNIVIHKIFSHSLTRFIVYSNFSKLHYLLKSNL